MAGARTSPSEPLTRARRSTGLSRCRVCFGIHMFCCILQRTAKLYPMHKFIILTLLSCTSVLSVSARDGRASYSMDFNWKFHPGDIESGEAPGADDSGWRSLDIPHDWSIEGEFDREAPGGGRIGYLPTGIGWYRKTFDMPAGFSDKSVWLDFEGVYMNSDVWLNGQHLGHRPYGYIGFRYDIGSFLKPEGNVLAVRVDNSRQPSSRWYSGSGIYRHVWLCVADRMHIDDQRTFITTPRVSSSSALVHIDIRVENRGNIARRARLRCSVLDEKHTPVVMDEKALEIGGGDSGQVAVEVRIENPALWSVSSPSLYTLKTEIFSDNGTTDQTLTTFGIRHIEYSADRGLLMNGNPVKMKGVCLHHGGGCVGAAVPAGVWKRRLEILREMGCNAIRTAHNPPAPEFLDLCDRMGFLVMDEAFDEWTAGKVEGGYHNYFNQWSQHDLVSFVRRDRNHPCVVMWSAGNEIGEQSMEGGEQVLKALIEAFHREDPTRPVTTGNDHIAADGRTATEAFLNMLDIVGYNYVDRWHERRELYYSLDHHAHPGWKVVGTESVSAGGVRGWYRIGDDPVRVEAAYNSGMIRAEQLWKFEALHDYVIGDFMWTGIDYLGEARWPFRNASSGIIDLCGFPKDGYYFYQSQWTTKPMIHIFPHWNWKGREGQVFPVLVYTNCDSVELFLNGKSYGSKAYEMPRQGTSGGWNSYAEPKIRTSTADLHLSWDVPYEPGVLRAVGRKDGKVAVTREIRTTGSPAALRLTTEHDRILSNGRDVAHIRVEVVDDLGNIVPDAANPIRFTLEGPARIIGTDNGNPMDHTSYSQPDRDAFNGLALVIIQAGRVPGGITLKVSSDGLQGASVNLESTEPIEQEQTIE